MRNFFNTFNSLLFLGSVFITSEKFVNPTISPKNYFVQVSLLIFVVLTALNSKLKILQGLRNRAMLWGISMVCFLQAGLGFIQYVGWFPSNHSCFPITGSFDNPAGFAAVLSLGFPVGAFLFIREIGIGKYFSLLITVAIALLVSLSGSRTGVIAIVSSIAVFLFYRPDLFRKFMFHRFGKLVLGLLIATFAIGSILLYLSKKDSADGRLLIWTVSAEMIQDKPLFGHGYGAFQANYMDYQATYFKENPNSKFALFADNVKHPFNEFIKVTVEFGLIGLVFICLLIFLVSRQLLKSVMPEKDLIFSGIVSFFVFASFSYPLQYAPVWLMLAFFLSALFSEIRQPAICNIYLKPICRSIVCAACVFALVHVYKQIRAEVKWKTIALAALSGNTPEMLDEYELLYRSCIKKDPYFLYNYGAELNIAKQFDKSIVLLNECQKKFNDYDLQMLLADNYLQNGDTIKAILIYQYASNMIPSRFLPLYRLMELYKDQGDNEMAMKFAETILEKKVKVQSGTIALIQAEANEFIYEIENQ